MTLSRRRILEGAGAALALSTASGPALSDAYPTRPVTIVVPVAAGGGVDALARILAEHLREKLKQTVVVENRPGAGSVVGAGFVSKAAPDGYTLLLLEPAAIVAKWLNDAVAYDVNADFTPVALVATQPLVFFAHPSVAANDVRELVGFCKANPRALAVGTAGVGSPHHLAALWLNTAAGIDIVHQPYRGAGPALNDLLGGHVPLIWALPAPVMPFVEEGKVKALAVSSPVRFPLLPKVPTVAESVVPGFDVEFFYGVAAPPRLPADVVARLAESIREIAADPAFAARMATMGTNVQFENPDRFRAFVAEHYRSYGEIVRGAGITPH